MWITGPFLQETCVTVPVEAASVLVVLSSEGAGFVFFSDQHCQVTTPVTVVNQVSPTEFCANGGT